MGSGRGFPGSAVGERLLLEGVTCPRCDSPLVSIDLAAGDDPQTRSRIRSLGGPMLVVVFLVIALALMMVPYALGIGSATYYALAAQVAWVLILAMMALKVRSVRAARMATCHACLHRWRVPLPGGKR